MDIDFLKAIKRVVLDGYFVPQNGNTVRLVEDANTKSGCREVTFKNAENVIVFKFDQAVKSNKKPIKEAFPFLSEESPARSKCDYILFHERESNGIRVIFVIVCNICIHFQAEQFFFNFLSRTANSFRRFRVQ